MYSFPRALSLPYVHGGKLAARARLRLFHYGAQDGMNMCAAWSVWPSPIVLCHHAQEGIRQNKIFHAAGWPLSHMEQDDETDGKSNMTDGQLQTQVWVAAWQ